MNASIESENNFQIIQSPKNQKINIQSSFNKNSEYKKSNISNSTFSNFINKSTTEKTNFTNIIVDKSIKEINEKNKDKRSIFNSPKGFLKPFINGKQF